MTNDINFGQPTEKQKNEYFHYFGKSIPSEFNNNMAGNAIGQERKKRADVARSSLAEFCGKNRELVSSLLGNISKKEAEQAYRDFGQQAKNKSNLLLNRSNN